MTNVTSANATGLPASPPPRRRKAKAPPPSLLAPFTALLEAPPPAIEGDAYRALTLHQHVPAGCEAHLVHHDRFAPHIKAGEFVIVDAADRTPAVGEIFLVRIDSSRHSNGFVPKLVQLWRPPPTWNCSNCWMLLFSIRHWYGRKLTKDEIVDKLRSGGMTLSDGPVRDACMHEKIIGRAVGILQMRGVR